MKLTRELMIRFFRINEIIFKIDFFKIRNFHIFVILFGAWRSPVSASVLGAEGRRFESRRPDNFSLKFSFCK